MHIKELRKSLKKRSRTSGFKRGQGHEAANTSGILNLSSDSIRSVGSQSYRERKDMSKLQKSQQKLRRNQGITTKRTKGRRNSWRIRNTIDKMRNEMHLPTKLTT